MKRLTTLFIIFAIIISVAVLPGCKKILRTVSELSGFENTENPYPETEPDEEKCPLYRSLGEEEKRIYGLLYNAMGSGEQSEVFIGRYSSRDELEAAKEWIDDNFRQIVFEHPDFFWIDPYNFTFSIVESMEKSSMTVILSYMADPDDIPAMKAEYEAEIERIVRGASEQDSLFRKVLYAYDEILAAAEYDKSILEGGNTVSLSAYGCLIGKRTVCSGYALAFLSVMQKLDIECGCEFNNYDGFSISEGHVWNYCQLDGEYYYFDLTWDDSTFDSEEYKPYLDFGHTYFAVSEEEYSKTNLTMLEDAPTPECNGAVYNYFVYTGANISEYDLDTVRSAIKAQGNKKFIALRFDSYSELLEAESDLIEDGEIYEILGIKKLTYVITDDGLHLYIFPK